MIREFCQGDWIMGWGLISDLDLSFEIVISRPLKDARQVYRQEQFSTEQHYVTYVDAYERGCFPPKMGNRPCVTKVMATTTGSIIQREPKITILLDKENGHLQLCIGNILPKVISMLGRPEVLRHNRTWLHNTMVKQPIRSATTILQWQRRISSRDVSNDEGHTTRKTYSLTQLCQARRIRLEQVEKIAFCLAGAEGVGNVPVDKESEEWGSDHELS
jgi:hypothetical protein